MIPEPLNPLGVDGIEFIEYATSQPQAFGALLQQMGFAAVARHRSREVVLYRQGAMNVIVNSHGAVPASPALAAIALRVRDAGAAYRRSLDLGAWEIEAHAAAMELNIPGIHGVGESLVYFVDRYRDFSIYDVDFVPLAATEAKPPALAGLHWFGVVQAILAGRTRDWVDFYESLFGFSVLPQGTHFGVLPNGTLLESPCHKFYLQLIEPPLRPGRRSPRREPGPGGPRHARRAGGGAGPRRARHRVRRSGAVQPSDKGALTQVYLGSVTFELVVSHL